MAVSKVGQDLFQVDLAPGNVESFISSYVLGKREAAIIESGPTSTVETLLAALKTIGVARGAVKYVLVSHIHLDHGGGAGALLQRLPKAQLVVHPRGEPHMVDPEKLWSQSQEALGEVATLYGRVEPVPEDRLIPATDGMTFTLSNNVELEAVETLGHASHHLSFVAEGGVFAGDAAGVYIPQFQTVLPTTPPPFHREKAFASIQRLVNVAPKNLYYTHFGVSGNAVAMLEGYKEQLTLWLRVVEEKMMEGEEDRKRIVEAIFEADKSLHAATPFIRNHLILSRSVFIQSIRGLINHFKWKRRL